MKQILLIFILSFFLSSCQTLSNKTNPQKAARQEGEESLYAIAGAVIGRPLTEEDKKKVQEQYLKNPEAKESMEAITGALSDKSPVKYCPVDGQRYSGHLNVCPDHWNVELKILEP
jgi:hypothetical protein